MLTGITWEYGDLNMADEVLAEARPLAEGKSAANLEKALHEELSSLIDVVGPVPIVDLLLERAFQLHATDIHMDPHEHGLRVRLRVDGMLHDVLRVPTSLALQVVSRVKLMSGMNIAEKRLAQDGHITHQFAGHQRDIRVGGGPTTWGERLVLRLMPDSQTYYQFQDLGLDPAQAQLLEHFLRRPYGMIMSVGPVGSGKSTTMYSCLDSLNEPTRSLVTIEDPIERRLDGANQIQVEPRLGFHFVDALRAVLRQDPNVMMIGEIRDAETAQIGVRAGQTGVLVLSTLHANDAASSIDVLRNFGVPSVSIADSLQAIISQRLLRKVCLHCRTTYHPDEVTCRLLGIDPRDASTVDLARGTGCDACFGTGYLGRTAVFEIMPLDMEMQTAILAGVPRSELLSKAISKGMQTLHMQAQKRLLEGITNVEEMHRVLLSQTET